MQNNILVQVKNVYGKEMVYPIGDNAKALQLLTGQKTLSRRQVDALKGLGFLFETQGATV